MINSNLVVHCKRAKYDVYIGRSPDPIKGLYGNPFSHKPDSLSLVVVENIDQAMIYCRRWLNEGEDFLIEIKIYPPTDLFKELMARRERILNNLPKLKGKVLGCWCKIKGPEMCHGDILAEMASNT